MLCTAKVAWTIFSGRNDSFMKYTEYIAHLVRSSLISSGRSAEYKITSVYVAAVSGKHNKKKLRPPIGAANLAAEGTAHKCFHWVAPKRESKIPRKMTPVLNKEY